MDRAQSGSDALPAAGIEDVRDSSVGAGGDRRVRRWSCARCSSSAGLVPPECPLEFRQRGGRRQEDHNRIARSPNNRSTRLRVAMKPLALFLIAAALFLVANRGAYQGYFSDDDLSNLSWPTFLSD